MEDGEGRMSDLIITSKQIGKSLKEDIAILTEPSLLEALETQLRKEARTRGEEVAAGKLAKDAVMAACGETILKYHPELTEKLSRGGRGHRDGFHEIERETGRSDDTIARWVEMLKKIKIAGGFAEYFALHAPDIIARWERSLLKGDLKLFNPEIAEGPEPQLYVGFAESLYFLSDESIDIIITSPPYNLGAEKWPMGGATDPFDPLTEGREERKNGIGYVDVRPEKDYQDWQIECLKELYRVAKDGASFFYNHKIRQNQGKIIHPIDWLRSSPWIIRQEIIWDRGSTHNHCAQLFWPIDERIYWLTKGKPRLPDKPIGFPTIWRIFGPVPNTWHPAPFSNDIPKRCLDALGWPGAVILDPFGGSMTTCYVAQKMGYQSIGVDSNEEFIRQAIKTHGWRNKINE